jgi:hypothetical protein
MNNKKMLLIKINKKYLFSNLLKAECAHVLKQKKSNKGEKMKK